jgi:hypothetical protein
MNIREQIFEQAYSDRLGVKITTPDSVSVIYRGVKVENKDGKARVLNMSLNGDFYKEITQDQYDIFLKYGFRRGVYEVCMTNYKRTLEMLSKSISNEVSKRNNVKHYEALKEYRNTIMTKITDTLKLKQAI